MNETLMTAIASIAVTQIVNTFVTVIVLNTKMKYFERDLVRVEKSVLRSHERIDELKAA